MKMLAAVPVVPLLAACATVPPQAPSVATIKVGEATRLGPLGIRVDRIVEDSRCPAQVQCVWQGRLVIAIFADDPAALARQGGPNARATAVAHETTLTLGDPGKPVLGRSIRLIDAQPEPSAGQTTRSDSYRLTLKVD